MRAKRGTHAHAGGGAGVAMQERPPARFAKHRPLLLVLLVGILAHGLILLTDYIIWDGWWANADLGMPEAGILARQFRESGKPLEGWFFLPLRLIASFDGRIAAAKQAGVACWIGSFLAVHACLRRLAGLEVPVALAIVGLAVAAPVYEVLGEVSLVMYPACMLLFWGGWLFFAAAREGRGTASRAGRVAAAAMLFLSFNVNSLLVMHYAVMVTFVVLRLRGVPWADIRGRLVRAALLYPEILALPVVFWIWKAVFTPTSGYYATYNRPTVDLAKLAWGYAGVWNDFFFPMACELVSSPLWVLAAIAAGAGLGWRLSIRDTGTAATPLAPPAHGWRLAACGLLLFAAAAFPYVAVGQPVMAHGWWSRCGILFPLPIAMTVVGLLVAVNRTLAPTRPFVWIAPAATVAVLFVGSCWRNTLTMQAFGAKQAAIRRGLRDVIDARLPAVIQFRDYFPIVNTNDYYPPAIWTFLAAPRGSLPTTIVVETGGSVPRRQLAGDESTINADGQPAVTMGRLSVTGAELEQLIETQTGMPYAMTRIRRTGPHLLVGIGSTPNVGVDGLAIGAEYLRRRWLAPSTLDDYVTSLVEGVIESLPPIE